MSLQELAKHLPIVSTILIMGMAWGQTQSKIATVEDAIKSNAQTQQQVDDLKGQVHRVDERTKMMQESQARQERLIEMMLAEQRRINRTDVRTGSARPQ
jgi:biopolymer transport protein ExbB/TolQ